jgi:hypothetical protein
MCLFKVIFSSIYPEYHEYSDIFATTTAYPSFKRAIPGYYTCLNGTALKVIVLKDRVYRLKMSMTTHHYHNMTNNILRVYKHFRCMYVVTVHILVTFTAI